MESTKKMIHAPVQQNTDLHMLHNNVKRLQKRPRPATKKPTKTIGIACTAVGKTAKAPRGGQPQCGKTGKFCLDFSNNDFFLEILPLKDDELVMSEM